MLLLGIDLGTSSIKVSVLDAQTQACIASARYPENEAAIISKDIGWAEQSPATWWDYTKKAILACNATGKYNPKDIATIGIAYQMHGLVLVDKYKNVLRDAIIWCDSRAVPIGQQAFKEIGEEKCLSHLLNSPGNFTAGKLAWVKKHEPDTYQKIDKVLLPGDYLALMFSGESTTTISALSEGIFWDFQQNEISKDIINYYGFDKNHFPEIKPLFSTHGQLMDDVAQELGLSKGIPIAYKAGDQPNNALSLNVMQPGEVATTAGTSGVIYAVSDNLGYDNLSRVNSFAHVNYQPNDTKIGVLLCINGTGIFYSWLKNTIGSGLGYNTLNEMASKVPVGSDGLIALPFGNGAERVLQDKTIGATFQNLNFNLHNTAHMIRAAQEGIAFSLKYGLDIMKANGINPKVIRASKANLFLSNIFATTFASVNNVSIEFYYGDGSFGAAIGAGVGAGIYSSTHEAMNYRKPSEMIEPTNTTEYLEKYEYWKQALEKQIQQ